MKTFDDNFEEELRERDVMAYFACDANMARKIIESSKLNGQIGSIKQKCKNGGENNG